METNFEGTQNKFQKLLKLALKSKKIDGFEKEWMSVDVGDQDKRIVLDGVLKDYILEMSDSIQAVEDLVTLSIELSRADLCSAGTPVVLLSDLFDILTLNDCQTLFAFVESNVAVWRDPLFFSHCKTQLLRMCNDLLRRLSKSQNTTFRGRILLFLSSFFPFSERSGLNIVSEFNLENANEYKKDVEAEEMETEEGAEEGELSLKLDFNLYSKFLTLQDFFRNPTLCYNKTQWGPFVLSWNEIFQTFDKMKLDAVTLKMKSAREQLADSQEGSPFFAKYLTNPRLLQLQLSDAHFRRSLLIQGLIILQYLSSPVKSKLDSYELRPVQQDWVKEQESLLYRLLAETPRGSQRFCEIVRQMLAREQLWNSWKNDGCPELKRPGAAEETDWESKRPCKRDDVATLLKNASKNNKYYMGSKELTRLWNINPKNLEACQGPERAFVPTIDSYLGEAVMQLDPAAGIEQAYKKTNDPDFNWRALRLLALRSPCFFAVANTPICKNLSDYIEVCLKRVMKDQTTTGGEGIELNKEEGEEETREKKDGADKEQTDQQEETKLTEETMEEIATRLGDEWLRLAAKLGYKTSASASELMKTWVAEDVDATAENVAYILEGLELNEAAEYAKSLCAH